MATRAEELLDLVRSASGNKNTDGIYDKEIMRYINDAQQRLQSLIVQEHNHTFKKLGYLNVVTDQLEYTLPSDIFTSGRIDSVFRKETQSVDANLDYYKLDQISESELNLVYGYIVRESTLVLSDRPQGSVTNGLRLVYTRRLPEIQIRRGKITSLSPLTVNTATVPAHSDWTLVDYVSIVSKDGVQRVTSVSMDAYTAGVITTTTPLAGAVIGDYVVFGANSSTHHQLPEVCERYLREYTIWRLAQRDSSADFSTASSIFGGIETELVELFAQADDDVKYVPVLDPTHLIY